MARITRRPLRRLVGALVAGAAATVALAGCGAGEGTVVAKAEQGSYDYACGAGGTMTSPVAAPVWGACSDARCWRLIVRDNDGDTFEPCVSREEYDRTQPGTFWHQRTDR